MINVSVDEVSLKEIEERLGAMRSKAPVLLKKSVNEVAQRLHKDVKKDTRSKYILSVDEVNDKIRLEGKTSTIRPRRRIMIKSSQYDLNDFEVRPGTYNRKRKIALKARVQRNESLTELINKEENKAFIALGKDRYFAVRQRNSDERYPLKRLRGPSMPSMVHTVWKEKQPDYSQRLRQSVEKHIKEVMGG